jgi:hypothetical protein
MVVSACSLLKRETEVLWRRIEVGSISGNDAEAVLQSICSRWDSVNQWVQLEVDHSLNLEAAETASTEVVNRYAS